MRLNCNQNKIRLIRGKYGVSAIILADGTIYTWGTNQYGEAGNPNLTNTYTISPTIVSQICFTNIHAGELNTILLKQTDGSAWIVGNNFYGQLGDNSTTSRNIPVSVIGGHSFIDVKNGIYHSSGLRGSDGTAWTWGYNNYGKLGDNSTTNRSTPVSVVGGHSFKKLIACGGEFSIGIRGSDGTAWTWGQNTFGQLGDNSTTSKLTPVSVVGAISFSDIAIGSESEFIIGIRGSDGTAWAWGRNFAGQLGDNSTTNKSTPVSVIGGISFKKLATGPVHSMGLRGSDEMVFAWGNNQAGQLGDNTTTNKSTPIVLPGGYAFKNIAVGGYSSFGIKSTDGTCWAWGENDYGQLGDISTGSKSTPISVIGNHIFKDISAGQNHTVGIDINGICWGWGDNSNGQLGDSTFSTSKSHLGVIHGVLDSAFISSNIGFSVFSMYAIRQSDGTCWSWGMNNYGQLGDNTTTSRSFPVSVVGGHLFKQVDGGLYTGIGIRSSDGTAWTWGQNNYGQLGDNSTTSRSTPVSVVGAHSFAKISAYGYVCAGIRGSDGTGWTWGDNAYGQLGDNSVTSRSTPVSVIGAHSYIDVSVGEQTVCFIRGSDGTAWVMGNNTYGQLGDNSTTSRSTPVSVVGANSYVKISAGYRATSALRGSDGTYWSWGINTYGGLGDNTLVNKSTPVSTLGGHSFIDVQNAYLTNFGLKNDGSVWAWGGNQKSFLGINSRGYQPNVSFSNPILQIIGNNKIVAGYGFTLTLNKDTGIIWAWGKNDSGQLGDNSTTSRSISVSVNSAISFKDISTSVNTSYGISGSDGSGWAWGYGEYGQLGDNSAPVSRSTPVSVVGGHSFKQLAGAVDCAYGIRGSDGTAWAWGYNTYGQLGDNSTTSKLTPISVVGAISFKQISSESAQYYCVGIRGSDGTAWSWGYNNYGQLGDNSTTAKSTPVSVVGGISFTKISAGRWSVIGIRGSDGTAWAWGRAHLGQLGINSTTNVSTPVSVVGGNSYIDISVYLSAALALRGDGTAWSWGSNTSGQLGDNSTTDKSTPVSVTGGHRFTYVTTSQAGSAAIKNDFYSTWIWGVNEYGQLGVYTDKLTPVLLAKLPD